MGVAGPASGAALRQVMLAETFLSNACSAAAAESSNPTMALAVATVVTSLSTGCGLFTTSSLAVLTGVYSGTPHSTSVGPTWWLTHVQPGRVGRSAAERTG